MEKASLILIILQVVAILVSWRALPPEVPLFYSRPWGEEQLIGQIGLFLIPCFSFLVLLINFTILKFVSKKESLLRQILISTAAFFSLIGLIGLIQIIRLVV